MKLVLSITTLFIHVLFFGQIEIKICSLKKVSPDKENITINITNLTNDYYALPFDKKGFKGNNIDEICSDLKDLDYPHRFFALSLMFKDRIKGEPIESLLRSYHLQNFDENTINQINSSSNIHKQEVLKWQEKNNLKLELDAERNFYIMNNLLLLAPKEKVTLNLNMNVYEIKRGDTMFYDYYNLENKKEYDFNVILCADKGIYNYLTDVQKAKLKKYTFFVGKIESNKISYIFSYE